MDNFIKIGKDNLELALCAPGSFYKGTRFDWMGVFRSIEYSGVSFSDLWFDDVEPRRHDNLTGCSEEFAPLWIDDTHCVKIGVGILSVPEGKDNYDRFKLYEIVDGGWKIVDTSGSVPASAPAGSTVRFIHILDDWYEYEKIITALDGGRFTISHMLRWKGEQMYRGNCYNHNFWTFDRQQVGPGRSIEFIGPVSGDWRADSVSGYKDDRFLRFERDLQPGEKCFIGNLTVSSDSGEGYSFVVREGEKSVSVRCNAPMIPSVFWSNHRVACVEPYVGIDLEKDRFFTWTIEYTLSHD